ncbi:hypothetical protein [Halarsenatibacter silvermanii]|uniref:AbiTii domain-containing protein n=1 Tax=Halarsenatibacter silvermanii TaxID=321763 RepID=UPI001179D1FB|nr:hypothetical protein [Halarsenatibacter silvermanii]
MKINTEIQSLLNACSRTENSIQNVLRKAELAAKNKGDNDFLRWIKNELEGYQQKEELPDFRIIEADLAVYDAFQGWQILQQSAKEINSEAAEASIKEPASELESVLEESKEEDVMISIDIPEDIEEDLRSELNLKADFAHVIRPPQLSIILEEITGKIHRWALESSPEKDAIEVCLSMDKMLKDRENKKKLAEKFSRLSEILKKENMNKEALKDNLMSVKRLLD